MSKVVHKINHAKIKVLILLKQKIERYINSMDSNNLISRYEKEILNENISLKDCHKNQAAVVIANGPSLSGIDLTKIGKHIKFTMSGFWKHEILNQWQPDYYCLIDKTFFCKKDEIIEFYKNLEEKIKCTYLLPLMDGEKFVKDTDVLKRGDKYYFLTYGDTGGEDFSGKLRGFQSVASFALANAVNMGCSPIYLIGFDHNFLANRGLDQHFYKGAIISNHWGNTVRLDQYSSYYTEMKSMMRLWEDYYFIKKMADKKNIKIFNATGDSYLDIFERMNYDDIS